MTTPSNTELREAIATQIYVMIGGHIITGKWDMLPKEFVPGVADDITKLFQAREQQLLTEILGELPRKHVVQDDDEIEDEFSGKALKHEIQENNINYGFNDCIDEVVSVIERYREGL